MATAKRIIQLARERALFCFPALIQQMLHDATGTIDATLATPSSVHEETQLLGAQQYLRQHSYDLQFALLNNYRGCLDRAMHTIYNDLRPGIGVHSAATLSLLEEETLIRQMDLERLTLQLREADTECLGLVNIMVAQLHGKVEVLERENPFRPYLLARSLYEALDQLVEDKETGKLLMNHLSAAMVEHLPDFYAEIRAAFEARGVRAKLMSRPMTSHQPAPRGAGAAAAGDTLPGTALAGFPSAAYQATRPGWADSTQTKAESQGGFPYLAPELLPPSRARTLPSLKRLLQWAGETGNAPDDQASHSAQSHSNAANPDALQDLIWNLFKSDTTLDHTPAVMPAAAPAAQAPVSEALLAALSHYQSLAAAGQAVGEQLQPEDNQLFAVREKVESLPATSLERMTIDLVAVLFEFILEDEQIPAEVRLQIGRLQIPLLKAAMLDSTLLRNDQHPARQLLNRLSSASIGPDEDSVTGTALKAEVTRVVLQVLETYDTDATVFETALTEFEQYLSGNLRSADSATADAIEDAEKVSVLLVNVTILLRDLVVPLKIDARVLDFILLVWARVLVRAYWLESVDGQHTANTGSLSQQFRDTLAELVWSAQGKESAAERNELLHILPKLVLRVKTGLHMIQLPEAERTYALDRLVEVHTHVLRTIGQQPAGSEPRMTLEQLRQHFARLVLTRDQASILPEEEWSVRREIVAELLEEQGLHADLQVGDYNAPVFEPDADILDQLQLGVSIECLAGIEARPMRLTWISLHKSLYLFSHSDKNINPLIYSPAAFLDALRDGTVRFVEYAPVFDRAVEALMQTAETVEAGMT